MLIAVPVWATLKHWRLISVRGIRALPKLMAQGRLQQSYPHRHWHWHWRSNPWDVVCRLFYYPINHDQKYQRWQDTSLADSTAHLELIAYWSPVLPHWTPAGIVECLWIIFFITRSSDAAGSQRDDCGFSTNTTRFVIPETRLILSEFLAQCNPNFMPQLVAPTHAITSPGMETSLILLLMSNRSCMCAFD